MFRAKGLAISDTFRRSATCVGRGRSSISDGNGCQAPHHVVPPLQCRYTTTPGRGAMRPGWLHTSYISILAESSPFCSSLQLPPLGQACPLPVRLRAAATSLSATAYDGVCGRGTGWQRSWRHRLEVTGQHRRRRMAVGRHNRGAVGKCWGQGLPGDWLLPVL
jgi:hypothetical protein